MTIFFLSFEALRRLRNR